MRKDHPIQSIHVTE